MVGSGVNFSNANEAALKLIEAPLVCALGLQVEEAAHGYELNCDEIARPWFFSRRGGAK